MIYLNNAATSYPKPASVSDAVSEYLLLPPCSAERGAANDAQYSITQAREVLSRFIGANTTSDVFFYSGATAALNQALLGFNLAAGDEVITTATEHNSVLRPLHFLARTKGIALKIIPCDATGHINADVLLNSISPKTKLVAVNHVSNVTGAVQPIQTIGQALAGLPVKFLVDASQSLGLYPVNVTACCIDMLAFTGHKFMYGTQGIGGLYIEPSLDLQPLHLGGTGAFSELLEQPTNRPHCYEAGTPNMPGIVALMAGLSAIKPQAAKMISHKVAAINAALTSNKHLHCICPQNSTIVSLVSQTLDLDDIFYLFENEFHIKARVGLHCSPLIHRYLNAPKGTLRLSPSVFTRDEDINAVILALIKITDVMG